MKSFFQTAAFAATASAAVLRRDQCCFQITATGGVSGVMGELFDGQNRINGSYSPATYCYSSGGIIDSAGRGCVVTYTNDATHQFQCDLNRPPTYGFTIASNGSILYQGNDQFYACPATDTEYNVYTTWLSGQDKCKPVTLSAGSMNGTCDAAPSGGIPAASGSAPGYSVPAYSSVAATAPVYSAPAESLPIGGTAPGYSAPAYTSTPIVSESVPTSAPGYSQPAISSYPISSVSESLPASGTAPGYTTSSIPVESTPVVSVPVQSIPVQGTTQAVPSYPAESSNTPVAQSYETTVTAQTTYYTTFCPVTETQVSSGSTLTNVYSTWSTFTAVGSSSTPEFESSASTVPGHGASSSVVSTATVPVASSSSVTVPSYSSSASSVSVPASSVSVTAYSSPAASSAVTVPAYSVPQSSISSVSVAATSAMVPAYNVTSQSTPVESLTTCTEETTSTAAAQITSVVVSTSQVSVPDYGSSAASSYLSASTPAVSSYAASSTQPATSTTASACQTSLTGAYQTPHLIVPVSPDHADTAYGTQYNATINSTTSTIFNFDIPASYSGKTCSIIFLFPEQADLETSAYTFSGSGSIVFSELSGVATEATTYDTVPSVDSTLDTIAIQSGNSYVVATTACAAGTTESIELSSSGGLSLEFFEDWNPSSLGLYITAC